MPGWQPYKFQNLCALGVRFGQGLQMTNILKDTWKRFVYWALLFTERASGAIKDWPGGIDKSSNLKATSTTYYTSDVAYTRPS